MAGTSQTIASHLLNFLIGGGDGFVPAGTLYVAMCTATPVPTGGGTIVEPNPATEYAGYARVPVLSSAGNWPHLTNGTLLNGTTITFPSSAGGASAPVSITNFALIDSAAGVGIVYAIAAAPGGLVIANGDHPSFAIGVLGFVLA